MDEKDVLRYFQSGNLLLCAARQVRDGTVYVANTHILVDPSDITSDPIKGWAELSEKEFFRESKALASHTKKVLAVGRRDEIAEQKKVYDESRKLGFSDASARRMSGYVD